MGQNPLVNSLIEKKDLDAKEDVFPLKVVRCDKCGLVQTEKPLDSHKIYKDVDYLYFSSDMPGLSDYFEEYARDVHDRFASDDSLIVEIGSNDGIMLEHFAAIGHAVLGVDPATNVAVRALAKGVPTIPLFFTDRLAHMIKNEIGQARVIYGNNCIAHIDDLDDVLKGVDTLLADDGVFIVECNYWGGMVKNTNYALVYHDHFSYFTVQNWIDFGKRFGFEPFDAIVTPAQGGSLRIFMAKDGRPKTDRYEGLLREETDNGYNTDRVCVQYGKNCVSEAKKLHGTIAEIKADGKSIAGYGAAAKGFSVLKLADIDETHIDYFVDDSPAKQGKYTPVTHIPIISREQAEKKLPDYFFITAPNYADVIMFKEKERGYKGGFILCDSQIL